MTAAPPITCRWTGEAFEPVGRYARWADTYYVVDQTYSMVEEKQRSTATHNHEFAWLSEAWQNLPESIAAEYPSPEHLRKVALIRTGFATRRDFVASSAAEAIRLAAFIRAGSEYAVITVSRNVVTEWTAMSQSKRAMGAAEFQRSKSAILDYVAGLIGVTADTLTQNAGQAA